MLRHDDLLTLQQQLQFLATPIVIIDTEATGGNLYQDRLTEVALIRFDEHGIHTYEQLINPQMIISPFIEELTGISNDMIASAPLFENIADELASFLQDAVLFAHNSRFDYHFLRLAFKRCGKHLSMPQLCTVKLSRQLYPEHFKHNLDSLIERFDIVLPQRHRAMADVAALTQFLAQASQERADLWQSALYKHITPSLLPHWLPEPLKQQLQALPDEYGMVLIWHKDALQPKVRVCEHMYHDMCHKLHAKQAQDWFDSIVKIEGFAAIGPLDAAIMSSQYADSKQHAFYTIRLIDNEQQRLQTKIQPLGTQATPEPPFGVFAHPKAAKKAVLEWAREHGFCPKHLDILPQTLSENTPCPIHSSKKCHGWCPQLHEQNDIDAALRQEITKLPIAGWQQRWQQSAQEVDLVTGQTKQWHVSGSAIQTEDGLWLWDARVFQALKEHFRKPQI